MWFLGNCGKFNKIDPEENIFTLFSQHFDLYAQRETHTNTYSSVLITSISE